MITCLSIPSSVHSCSIQPKMSLYIIIFLFSFSQLSVKLEANEAITISVGQKIVFKPEMGSIMKLGSLEVLGNAEYSFDLTSGIWSNTVFGNSTNLIPVSILSKELLFLSIN